MKEKESKKNEKGEKKKDRFIDKTNRELKLEQQSELWLRVVPLSMTKRHL